MVVINAPMYLISFILIFGMHDFYKYPGTIFRDAIKIRIETNTVVTMLT